MKKKVYNFTVIIERDEDGMYVGSAPALRGCHTQGKTMDNLLKNMKEAIELCLEVKKAFRKSSLLGYNRFKFMYEASSIICSRTY